MANPKGFFIKGTNIPSLGKHGTKFGLYCRIAGFENVERALYGAVSKIRGRTRAGVVQAIEYLENQMETVEPLVPERTGNLKRAFEYKEASTSTPENPTFIFGYKMDEPPAGAPYVWYVHEMTSPPYDTINWTTPGSGPRWFQIHIQMDRPMMLEIIEKNAFMGM